MHNLKVDVTDLSKTHFKCVSNGHNDDDNDTWHLFPIIWKQK